VLIILSDGLCGQQYSKYADEEVRWGQGDVRIVDEERADVEDQPVDREHD